MYEYRLLLKVHIAHWHASNLRVPLAASLTHTLVHSPANTTLCKTEYMWHYAIHRRWSFFNGTLCYWFALYIVLLALSVTHIIFSIHLCSCCNQGVHSRWVAVVCRNDERGVTILYPHQLHRKIEGVQCIHHDIFVSLGFNVYNQQWALWFQCHWIVFLNWQNFRLDAQPQC